MIWVWILVIIIIGFIIYLVWRYVQQNAAGGSYIRIIDVKSKAMNVEWGNGPVVSNTFTISVRRKFFIFYGAWSVAASVAANSTSSGSQRSEERRVGKEWRAG